LFLPACSGDRVPHQSLIPVGAGPPGENLHRPAQVLRLLFPDAIQRLPRVRPGPPPYSASQFASQAAVITFTAWTFYSLPPVIRPFFSINSLPNTDLQVRLLSRSSISTLLLKNRTVSSQFLGWETALTVITPIFFFLSGLTKARCPPNRDYIPVPTPIESFADPPSLNLNFKTLNGNRIFFYRISNF